MPTAKSHRREHIEPERHDEIKAGTAQEHADTGRERTRGGQLTKGAKLVPTMGGKARKGRTKLSHDVGDVPVSEVLRKRARYMRAKTCTEIARTHGGGECGIVASVMVKLASEDLALREAAMQAGEIDMARKLGESARMHLLYARESARKDAEARADAKPASGDAMAAVRARILGT